MGNQLCKICASRPDVLANINAMLTKGTPLRVIVRESGFSRAGLSRHHRKCVPRAVLNTNRDKRHGSPHVRLVTQWPDGSTTIQHDPQDAMGRLAGAPVHEFRLDDVILQVTYAQKPIHNPDALQPPDVAAANRKARAEKSVADAIARKRASTNTQR